MTTENQPEQKPGTEPGTESETEPETDVLVPELVGSSEELTAEAVGKPVRRGRIAAIAGAALLAVAVIGGVGYTVVTVNGADRDAGDAVWTLPKVSSEKAVGGRPSTLAAALVPYGPDGWSQGPDIAEYGHDVDFTGAQAAALRKESLKELPAKQRKPLEKEIDKQHTKGLAMRSYVSTDEQASVYTDKASTVSIVLAQIADKTAVRNASRFQNELFDSLGVFRPGPSINGYKNAECFLSPKDADEKLDTIYCSAYQGEILVTLTAKSARPMQTYAIGRLLQEQLDRIKDPGEAV
ncbi:hypothetical protein OH768_24070 [Streptomyces sp. NBC_01622]|uniref:hypothetical protein n=1 Tax=Streptomyces sp. NBC_01622 TaxID=2975903 RepID=UPI00386C21E3|nr:hypothetical protein OH768_24070 [Streptomyces sp. NBC_01622]